VRVLLLDHAEKVAEKIRISGGGRCNFTNVDTGPANFDSTNADYCRSALARFTPRDFVALVERHGIAWHEKHKGQLFCDDSSARIVDMLLAGMRGGGVERWQPCAVTSVSQATRASGSRPRAARSRRRASSSRPGGLSIPKIGATDWGYALARQFGHWRRADRGRASCRWSARARPGSDSPRCSGVALPVRIAADSPRPAPAFDEDLLFTHRGLSGPAALQISTFWRPGESVSIDLAPGVDLEATFRAAKSIPGRRLGSLLAELLPRRLAEAWLQATPGLGERRIADLRDRDLSQLATALKCWRHTPAGSEGYRKAEVTAGGVDTRELDSRSGESRRVPGLYFIGEVVDVTGWLGGYNFQWAWASAAACAGALGAVCRGAGAGL
jgi:predicted Rossmann fold flavoprotein